MKARLLSVLQHLAMGLMFFAGASSATAQMPATAAALASMQMQQTQQSGNTNCPGGLQNAVQNAVNLHMQIAQIQPNIEGLFSNCSNCFAGATALFDLSPTIPSLQAIIGMAENALMQYIVGQICTAVAKVEQMVTSTVSNALSQFDVCVRSTGMMGANGMNLTLNLNSCGGTPTGTSASINAAGETQVTSHGTTITFTAAETNFGGSTQAASLALPSAPLAGPVAAAAPASVMATPQQAAASLQATMAQWKGAQGDVQRLQAQADTCHQGGNAEACQGIEVQLNLALQRQQQVAQRLNQDLSQARRGVAGGTPTPPQAGTGGDKNAPAQPTLWQRMGNLFSNDKHNE